MCLEEDSECEICRAATLEQVDSRVEVNIVPHSQPTGRTWLIPGTLELFRTPSLDALDLRRIDQGDVSCRHAVLSRRLHSLFGQTTRTGLPIAGDFLFSQKFYDVYRVERAIRSAFSLEISPSSRSVTSPCCHARVL